MSDDAIVGAIAGLLLGNIHAERANREKTVVTFDEAKAARRRAFTAAEIAFRRDLDNSKTHADCDDALALCKARLDEAHAQFVHAVR